MPTLDMILIVHYVIIFIIIILYNYWILKDIVHFVIVSIGHIHILKVLEVDIDLH